MTTVSSQMPAIQAKRWSSAKKRDVAIEEPYLKGVFHCAENRD